MALQYWLQFEITNMFKVFILNLLFNYNLILQN